MSEDLKNVTATVKWFKADKGYGFVRLSDGEGEAFLHSSAFANLGDVPLTAGMRIVCDIAQESKGPQVTAVHELIAPTPTDTSDQGQRPPGRQRRTRERAVGPVLLDEEAMEEGSAPMRSRRNVCREQPSANIPATAAGTVRWYNLDSQSGIIDPYDGGDDVLFDRMALRRSGIEIVADGEDVWFVAYYTGDGRVAEQVSLAPTTSSP